MVDYRDYFSAVVVLFFGCRNEGGLLFFAAYTTEVRILNIDILHILDINILIELFGYIGTILVVVSMMMTSVTKLRVVNMCGSVISAIYAAICGTWPIVVMNVSLFLINGFQLIKGAIAKIKER
jgi:hypothetical protein